LHDLNGLLTALYGSPDVPGENGRRRQRVRGLPPCTVRAATPQGSARSVKGGLVDFFRVLVSIIIPPLGVFWQVGLTGQFWLNVVLTILGYVPGLIHAIYIILTRR
jgi:uncharacterized membrane protein YqaE (UPF0057 family)